MIALRRLRIEPDRLCQVGNREIKLAPRPEQIAPSEIGRTIDTIGLDRPVEVRQRIVISSQLAEGQSTICIGRRIGWPQCDRFAKVRNRFLVLPDPGIGRATRVERAGVGRVALHNICQRGDVDLRCRLVGLKLCDGARRRRGQPAANAASEA